MVGERRAAGRPWTGSRWRGGRPPVDQLGEPRGHRRAGARRDQPEGQRPDVRRLGLHGEGAVRADELPPPGVERARRDVAVPAPLLLGQPEHLGDPDHGRRRAVQVGRRHLGLVGPHERTEVGRRPRPAPATRPSGSRCPTGTARARRAPAAPRPGPGAGRPRPRPPRSRPRRSWRPRSRAAARCRRRPGRDPRARTPRRRPSRPSRCSAPSGPSKPSAGGHGEMLATQPSARWSSATSRSHLRVKASTSYRYAAVGAKTCQSPVQPARSRCGQSVGMSHMFARRDHTTASCSRLTRSSLQENQPSRRRSECTTTPVTSSGPSGPG